MPVWAFGLLRLLQMRSTLVCRIGLIKRRLIPMSLTTPTRWATPGTRAKSSPILPAPLTAWWSYTDALGHDYVPEVTEPTCTEQGYTTYTCSRCGDSYVTDYVDALGHEWDEGRKLISTSCKRLLVFIVGQTKLILPFSREDQIDFAIQQGRQVSESSSALSPQQWFADISP